MRGATYNRPADHRDSWISIHAPREGSDPIGHLFSMFHVISIHAPREGSDFNLTALAIVLLHFYPRSP